MLREYPHGQVLLPDPLRRLVLDGMPLLLLLLLVFLVQVVVFVHGIPSCRVRPVYRPLLLVHLIVVAFDRERVRLGIALQVLFLISVSLSLAERVRRAGDNGEFFLFVLEGGGEEEEADRTASRDEDELE